MDGNIFEPLAIALGLGLLVGLQREWARAESGIRTFPLITLLGAICGLLAAPFGGWVLAGGFVTLGGTMIMGNWWRGRRGDSRPGPTTEIAAYVMFGVGALLAWGELAAGVAVGGVVAVLLQWKKVLHGFVKRTGEDEIRAVFRLALIALVILPILPNESFGPYAVLNPFRIWLMVVLIVGISVGGFLAAKYLGPRAGSLLGGVLGGVISSTATSVSYARRSRETPGTAALTAGVIMIASTIVFVRVSIEVALVAPAVLPHVLPQFGLITAWMTAVAAWAFLSARGSKVALPESKDPSDLPAAVVFGILYAAVLYAVAAAQTHFGDRGLYVVAALSGLTDMDAITLSTAQMMDSGSLAPGTGWRMMLVGALCNLVFKGAVVGFLGPPALLRRIALYFGFSGLGGVLVLLLWP